MKLFYLFTALLWGLCAWGQAEYFAAQNKQEGLLYYKKLLYSGCGKLKEKQDAVSADEMDKLIKGAKEIVLKNFSKAFRENPKIRTAFENELLKLMADSNCQLRGNDCRAKILGTSLFYITRLRADLPECQSGGEGKLCELEKKYRQRNFQGVTDSSYNLTPAATYRNLLVKIKNDMALDLFKLIMQKEKNQIHICEGEKGEDYRLKLEISEPGIFVENLDPDYSLRKEIEEKCEEDKKNLYSKFYSSNFDRDRSTVGIDQVTPVKEKILDFFKSNPDAVVTDVLVTVTSSRTPVYLTVNGKKVIDPASEEKNLSLAKERAEFIKKVFNELKNSQSDYKGIRFLARASLAGPKFDPRDLNDRFVTRMTAGYFQRIESLYNKYRLHFEKEALKESAEDLFSESEYSNLYQVKFKPFHGFRIQIFGYRKDEMKCLDESPSNPSSSASRQ